MHIAIAGNIGSGKTTLTTLLSKKFKWKAQYEDVENNPYLNDFYKDMQRWSFNLQVYFLNSRFRQIVEINIFKIGPSMKMHIYLHLIYIQWDL
jgi:deoxyadenosine/deoxycytidine kinase